ncbi:CK1:TTBK protein kinase [Trichuris trichiura]|uniref:CK1:TTBK protein kinase n=1 Tax=Trichuris trichiura TaxID=36087 RepID=A0A077YXU0_TRITR|nr:CK1:TTBK protein kinase [Trichuris trichiura]
MEKDKCIACSSDLVKVFPWIVPRLEGVKTVDGQWKIQSKIKTNDYLTVFKVTAMDSSFSGYMKAEYAEHKSNVLEMEVYILSQLERHTNFCTLHAYETSGDIRYIVVGPVGKSLREVMRELPKRRFTNSTILRIGIQCVDAIAALHYIGYVHRNITPDNLIIDVDMANAQIVRIWQFVTARRHVDENGEIRKPRSKLRCRGDYNYASVSVQEGSDSGRVDDLWSLIYTLSEFYNGKLPWRGHCSAHVLQWKQFMSMQRLFQNAPYEIGFIIAHLRDLEYQDEPNYDWIIGMFETAMQRCNISHEEQFDWQQLRCSRK